MVIFDASTFQPPWGTFLGIFVIILLVVVVLYYEYRAKEATISVSRRFFLIFGLTILFIIAELISYRIIIGNDNDLKNLLENHQCKMIEGTLKNLTRGVGGKAENESFTVNSVYFRISPAIHGQGFNQPLTTSNLAKNGDRVKLCYVKSYSNNLILYIYVFARLK